MARTPKVGGERKFKPSSYHGWHPWRVERRDNSCTIAAYVKATELWQTIAVINGTSGANKDITRLVKLVNDRKDDVDGLRSAFEAVKAIETEGLTFTTEQELEHVIRRLEQDEL